MENIILHSTPLKDFRQIFSDLLDEKLIKFKPENPPPKPTNEFMTRREVCELLHISMSTLHYYSKDGTLQSYRIAGRVLYKAAEVQEAVQEIQSIKYRRAQL
jgi:predicted DNA-binding transcriptional regulator AlpA